MGEQLVIASGTRNRVLACKLVHSTVLRLLEARHLPPDVGFDAALSSAANLGVVMCYYDDATMERMFREWLAKVRAVQHTTGGSA